MNPLDIHDEWLSLIEVSGPFLATPVLKRIFSTGLPAVEPRIRQYLRQAYDEWCEARDNDDPRFGELHRAWIHEVLARGLEYDESDSGELLLRGERIPSEQRVTLPEHGVTLEPDYALISGGRSQLLVQTYSAGTDLQAALKLDGWSASPAERMERLCRASGCRLGLVTDGERWMLVDAPVGAVSTFASWYARLWGQERLTLQAFLTLLGIRRFFGPDDESLPSMLDESLQHQEEVTDALGEQVRRAVEVLIQALGKEDRERSGALLQGVEPTELYEAGLTIMMRLVFLLSAEERGLLLMGEEAYESNYAISTLRMQLRQETEEVLERRNDAWSRLLATFRVVYGGIEHEALRLPALGGSLFDPDRFPFLEGRSKGSDWKIDSARPLPIDNRTVLLLLEAIQQYEGRTLSYRALDVEQIGYVYEGLLERTVARTDRVTVELTGGKGAKKTIYGLEELEALHQRGREVLAEALSGSDAIKRGAGAIRKDLERSVDAAQVNRLLTACAGDEELRNRALPFLNLLRTDPWSYPLIYPQGAFIVTAGNDRRETGTHYTPKSLTEAIVEETLEPVVYFGPAEGHERKNWQLKLPSEILDLKICDLAMGSGAFLVQVCRWLSERLLEAWSQAEANGDSITHDGVVVHRIEGQSPLSANPEERLVTARRLISERCLYGVDINLLAVELAKLSIWLVTLAKGRPFGFLDHNLRQGDSLLGIIELEQLHYLDMNVGEGSGKKLFAQKIDQAVQEAIKLRLELRQRPVLDIHDVEVIARLDQQVREKLELPELVADALVGETLKGGSKQVDVAMLSIEAGQAFDGNRDAINALIRRARAGLSADLPTGKPYRKPLHWCLEFPEVFLGEKKGFDAVVGNPPFKRGHDISGDFGMAYRDYISSRVASGNAGRSDFCAFFICRSIFLTSSFGAAGLIATKTISESDTRRVAFEGDSLGQFTFKWVMPNLKWPGNASIYVSPFVIKKGGWSSFALLNNKRVGAIDSNFKSYSLKTVHQLSENEGCCFVGSYLRGEGFVVSKDKAELILSSDPKYSSVLFKYLNGVEFNSIPCAEAERYAINFWDYGEDEAKSFSECYEIIEASVKGERASATRKNHRDRWWIYAENRPGLYHSVGMGCYFRNHPKAWKAYGFDRLIAKAKTSNTWAFEFLPNSMIYDQALTIVASGSPSVFASLQSTCHEIWARCSDVSSKHENRLRYSSTTFETFPFPIFDKDTDLSRVGEEYHKARVEVMRARAVGLTPLYQLFHDSAVLSEDVQGLRELHRRLDEELVLLYGWADIALRHDFYEVDYLPDGENLRFTVCEEAKNEILHRLIELNNYRHNSEKSAVEQVGKVVPSNKSSGRSLRNYALGKMASPEAQLNIFGQEDE
ncbi:hypothetical protein LO767_03760 [Halopseudomonas aestusnigri]|uniref:Eco57I restriction-modification methylase domain-containing protein n=1 Tax=Halopseudomonas aestusnigri TaxID=857252 RepID=UPI001E32F651|nr:type IIL restriction-modification enzyme MmeI [Halopseudomonas aestusnigri]UGV31629.1 hypothetical protein LO767_03760 [Halopseudomonas aestusnigri]